MSDKITQEVHFEATGTDAAAAQIRKLERELDNLKDKLQKSFKPNARITGQIIDPKVIGHLERMGTKVTRFSDKATRDFRKMARAGELNADVWQGITDELAKYEKQYKRIHRIPEAHRKQLSQLIAKAGSFRDVWNSFHDEQQKSIRRIGNLQKEVDDRKAKRHKTQVDSEARARFGLAKDLARMDKDNQRRQQAMLGNRIKYIVGNAREEQRQAAAVEREKVQNARAEQARLFNRIRFIRGNYEQEQRLNREGLRERQRAVNDIRQGGGRAAGRATTAFHSVMGPAAAMLGVGAAGAAAVGSSLMTRMRVSTAETKAQIFGGMSQEDVVKMRSDWGDKTALEFGLSPDRLINAFTEVLKTGIDASFGKEVTQSILKGATGLDMDVENTTRFVGVISTLLQEVGKFDPSFVHGVVNSVSVAAAATAADSNQIVAGLRRGGGIYSATKIKPDEASALVAGAISGGMQSSKAGTFLDAMSRLAGAGSFRGQRAKDVSSAATQLGFGSRQNLARQMAQNPMETMQNLLERMGNMPEEKRQAVATKLAMNEWSGELLQMVDVRSHVKRALDAIRKDPGFVDKAAQTKLASMAGQWMTFKASFTLLWEKIGSGFEDAFLDITGYMKDAAQGVSGDTIRTHVKALLDGLLEGLGVKSFRELLVSAFGQPGRNLDFAKSFKEFGKGFSTGLKQIWDAFSGLAHFFGGGSAEGLGKLIGNLLGLAFALRLLSPVVGVLSFIGNFILALVGVATMFKGFAGLLKGGAAAGGAAAGGGLAGRLGALVGMAPLPFKLAAIAAGLTLGVIIMNWDKIKGWFDSGIDGKSKEQRTKDLIEQMDKHEEKRKKNPDFIDKFLDFFGPSKANASELPTQMRRLTEQFKDTGAKIERVALATPGMMSSSVPSSVSGGGAAVAAAAGPSPSSLPRPPLAPDLGIGSRGIIGGGGATGDRVGGSRSWRNNNPGNIEFGAFARSMGATGTDGRFAKFPSYEAGRKAQEKLLFESRNYKDLTLGQAIRRWAPASENNVPAYLRAMGADPNTRMNQFSPEQRKTLLDNMQRHEGWRVGTVRGGGPATASLAPNAGSLAGGADPLGGIARRVSSEFGMRGHPVRGGRRMHWGTDLAAPAGSAVSSMLGGQVTKVNGYGDVTVRHADGSTRTYRHIVPSVQAGQQVEQGANIGKLRARDPRSTGPHLHLEATDPQGNRINPSSLLNGIPPGIAGGQPTPQSVTQGIPAAAGGGGGASRGGGQQGAAIHAPITINGAGQNAQQIAQEVQRHISDAMNWRTHDVESTLA